MMAVAFARVLRGAGVDVAVSSVVDFAQAVELTGDLYWSGRATLVKRPEDVSAYDDAFAAFFLGAAPPPEPPADIVQSEASEGPYSRVEVLRQKDFAAMTEDERAEAYRLVAALRVTADERRSRRLVKAKRGALDVRRTIKDRQDRLHFKGPAASPRRLVLLLDVSGSMEPYARALVRFLHAAITARRRVEAFAVGTRVTRMTRELRWRDPDHAIAQAAARVQDWSGGTRLGEGLRDFNDVYGARGATVVVLSDGWDRGDPALLQDQAARLQRAAHKVVWVNPHKASPGYEPLARGMAAALPHVDCFVEGHSVASLEALAQVIR